MRAIGALISDAGWRAVVAAFVLNGLLFGLWAARVPAFKDRFQLEPGPLGWMLLALAFGAIVAFPIAGALMERWGVKRMTLLCAIGYVPALCALAFAPDPLVLTGLLFIFGAFHGSMDIAMNGWAARVESRLGINTMSIFHALFSLGAGIGAFSGAIAAQLELSLTTHFVVAALVGGIFALPLIWWAPSETLQNQETSSASGVFALPSRALFLIGMIAFAAALGEGAMADWSAVFLRVTLAASEADAALGYAVFSVAMVVTRLLGGLATSAFGPVNMTRASTAIAFLGLMIAITSASQIQVFAGFALIGIGYAVIMPLVFSRAANDPHIPPGPALASVATFGYGGMLLGPPIVGMVAQATNLRTSFLVLAALAALAFALAPRLKPRA